MKSTTTQTDWSRLLDPATAQREINHMDSGTLRWLRRGGATGPLTVIVASDTVRSETGERVTHVEIHQPAGSPRASVLLRGLSESVAQEEGYGVNADALIRLARAHQRRSTPVLVYPVKKRS